MLSKRPTMPAIPFLLPLPPAVTISSHRRQKEFHDHGSISTLNPRKLGKIQEEQNSRESEDDFETIPTHKKTSLSRKTPSCKTGTIFRRSAFRGFFFPSDDLQKIIDCESADALTTIPCFHRPDHLQMDPANR
jgi:hypothetical protein